MLESLFDLSYCNYLIPFQPRVDRKLQDRVFTDVIVHAGIVFQCNCEVPLLHLFTTMINNPKQLKVCCAYHLMLHWFVKEMYLPTMPECSFHHTKEPMLKTDPSGKYYS